MGEIQKTGSDTPIHVGTSPSKLLKERGLEVRGAGFAPEVPDYLGYVLGLAILWLVYTGYSSVMTVVTDPNSTINRIGTRAKAVTTETARSLVQDERAEKVLQTVREISTEDSMAGAVEKLESKLARARLDKEAVSEPEPVESDKGWISLGLEKLNLAINSWSKDAGEGLRDALGADEPARRTVKRGRDAAQAAEAAEVDGPSGYEQF